MSEHEPGANESLHDALARARAEIERIDRALVGLLAERVERSRRIGRLKSAAGLPVHDAAREAEVMRLVASVARDHGLPDAAIRDLYWQIIALSREAQEGGPRG
jgi:chorismate mutase